MYRIGVRNAENTHEYEELVKIFLRPEDYEVGAVGDGASVSEPAAVSENSFDFVTSADPDKNVKKQEIYSALQQLTGESPEWGIITGIRPVKLFGDLVREAAGICGEGGITAQQRREALPAAEKKFREYYFVSEEKTELTRRIYELQQERFGEADERSMGVYAGIPFCPTRCLYCSFASNPITGSDIEGYLDALIREVDECAAMAGKAGMHAESIYLGGGTPTSLEADQIDRLLGHIEKGFMGPLTKEATIEAGRPDTITEAKLKAALTHGFGRISINPQSMKQETLTRIGRDHTPDDIRRAFEMTRASGDWIVNADIIAGLPGEDEEDIVRTLEEIIGLGAENITVHSLAVKRTSRLKEKDPEYHYKRGKAVKAMLDAAKEILEKSGYRPYYLYRQKHMSGALENVGYALAGTESLYNVRIMDEHQSILAMGAGGIGKDYDPAARQLSRVPNVKDYKVYIDRIEEMIRRKEKMFQEV